MSIRCATKNMNEKILLGWSVVNMTCPIMRSENDRCEMPIIRDLKQNLYCPKCSSYLVEDSSSGAFILQKDVDEDESNVDEMDKWTPPTKEEQDQMRKQQKKRDAGTAKVGEKLLLGWTMMNAACPVPDCCMPLMRNPEKQLFCVACDQRVLTPEEAEEMQRQRDQDGNNATNKRKKPSSIEEANLGNVSPQNQQHSSDVKDFERSDDDMDKWTPPTKEEQDQIREQQKKQDAGTAKVGEKLLLGWTMMNAACPVPDCCMPLMRNPEKQLFCVACDQRVLTPEEAEEMQRQRDQDVNNATNKRKKPSSIEENISSISASSAVETNNIKENETASTTQIYVESDAVDKRRSSYSNHNKNININITSSDLDIQRTIRVLREKMNVLTQLIEDSGYGLESREKVQLLNDCGEALMTMIKLSKMK